MSAAERQKIIVIGAGLGGISAAISMASEGFDVELFEKNERIGGKLNILHKDGYTFDLGPSILILPDIFRRLFKAAGEKMEDYLELIEMNPQWRNFFEDKTVIDLYADIREMETQLAKFLPKDVEGYYTFIDYSRKLWKFAEEAYFARGADYIKDITAGYKILELIDRSDYFSSMARGIGRYIKNPYLKNIMNFFIKYIGSSSYNAPAIFNLLPYSQLAYGEWYVKGGMYNIAKGLGKLLDKLGVETHLNSEVVEIAKDGPKVKGIRLKGGAFKSSDIIISNMEVIPAYNQLLNEDKGFLADYEKKFEPSCSGLVIHLGVDREYPQLQHHNFFFSKNQKKHFDDVYNKKIIPEDPTIYLVAPTRTDKTLAPKGHEIIKILPHIPYLQEPPFEKGEYERLKERLYIKLERMGLDNLRNHIVVEDMLIPDDIKRMYLSNKGSIYGIVADKKKNRGIRAPQRSERYHNLYFVGGSVNPGSGMPMVLYSGQMIKDKILNDLKK